MRERAEAVVEAKRADTPFEKAWPSRTTCAAGSSATTSACPRRSAGGNQPRRFLTEVREGYCEQFAIAMAMMARYGVPSRVAVGFTPGEIVDKPSSRSPPTTPMLARAVVPRGRLGAVRADPAADGTVSVPFYTTPADGSRPAVRARSTVRPTTGPDSAATPNAEAPNPGRPGSDPLAGTGADRGWLERPVVRAGLAVVLLVLVPGSSGRNVLARRRAGGGRATPWPSRTPS